MLLRNISFVMMLSVILLASSTLTAQEKESKMHSDHSMMQDKDMHKYMDKIASDEHMRGEMMGKMMEHMKGDSTGMMQMCKMMMDNSEMMKMMMKMMHGKNGMKGMMGGNMMHNDSTKAMDKSEHEKHHNK